MEKARRTYIRKAKMYLINFEKKKTFPNLFCALIFYKLISDMIAKPLFFQV
jgi:hypothetical protein